MRTAKDEVNGRAQGWQLFFSLWYGSDVNIRIGLPYIRLHYALLKNIINNTVGLITLWSFPSLSSSYVMVFALTSKPLCSQTYVSVIKFLCFNPVITMTTLFFCRVQHFPLVPQFAVKALFI